MSTPRMNQMESGSSAFGFSDVSETVWRSHQWRFQTQEKLRIQQKLLAAPEPGFRDALSLYSFSSLLPLSSESRTQGLDSTEEQEAERGMEGGQQSGTEEMETEIDKSKNKSKSKSKKGEKEKEKEKVKDKGKGKSKGKRSSKEWSPSMMDAASCQWFPMRVECLINLIRTSKSSTTPQNEEKLRTLLEDFLQVDLGPTKSQTSMAAAMVAMEALRELDLWLRSPNLVTREGLFWGKEYLMDMKATSASLPFGPRKISKPVLRLDEKGGEWSKKKSKSSEEREDVSRAFLLAEIDRLGTLKGEESIRGGGSYSTSSTSSTSSNSFIFSPFVSSSQTFSSSADFESRSVTQMSDLLQTNTLFRRVIFRAFPATPEARVSITCFFPGNDLWKTDGEVNEYEMGTYHKIPGFVKFSPSSAEVTVEGHTFYGALVSLALVCLRNSKKMSRTKIQAQKAQTQLLAGFLSSSNQVANVETILNGIVIPCLNSACFTVLHKEGGETKKFGLGESSLPLSSRITFYGPRPGISSLSSLGGFSRLSIATATSLISSMKETSGPSPSLMAFLSGGGGGGARI